MGPSIDLSGAEVTGSLPAASVASGQLGVLVQCSSHAAVTTAGTGGSATVIPTLSWNAQGQITGASSNTFVAGDPDIVLNYAGDIFDSTTTYLGGVARTMSHYTLAAANYDVYIDSATTDSFGIRVSTRTSGTAAWKVVETITVPASVSTHTVAATAFTLAPGDLVQIGFTSTTTSDPAGDITFRIKD